jgi:transcriptional regulator GlxA family with amidase domain
MPVKRIGFVGYDDITALDLVGPMEAFDSANGHCEKGAPAYAFVVLSHKGRPFRSEAGLKIAADAALEDAPSLDTIIIPGGRGLRLGDEVKPIARWLKTRSRHVRRLASVCTGIYALGEAGLMDGRRATTHWRYAADVARRFPAIRLEPDAIYIRDGHVYTSAGVTAGIDLSLSFIEEDLGGRIALATARELVVYLKRTGGQMQFSEPLQFQARATDRFADLAAWLVSNLKKDLSVEMMAERVGLGERHFSRRFKSVFGTAPADYVEALRLDESRKRLGAPNQTIDSVAASVGYASADAYRRAFERRFGVAPSLYKKKFVASA